MLFPDYFFFAERRLLNHELETKYVKDLDQCELFCYMNDNCVSANFKKDPKDGGTAFMCELNKKPLILNMKLTWKLMPLFIIVAQR